MACFLQAKPQPSLAEEMLQFLHHLCGLSSASTTLPTFVPLTNLLMLNSVPSSRSGGHGISHSQFFRRYEISPSEEVSIT